ncbi:MAG: carbohydrate binding family 9 domain-containing protein [Acidobacteria bacterium]|nr:carbohydrate binding family 9 domain-containing protein [Acidobacteriota bacterium]
MTAASPSSGLGDGGNLPRTGSVPRAGSAALLAFLFSALAAAAVAQDAPPVLRASPGAERVTIDGMLSEAAWAAAEAADAFAQTEPQEGAPPSFRTTVRVLSGSTALVIGIQCDDDPARIVSFSVGRDAAMQAEDHVRVVLGPFLDGRSGYVFAVNPRGARYDSVINSAGDGENAEWDGIWEAATSRSERGWSVEIRIPVRTFAFKPGLHEWHFNVQRRVQRLLETDRWASPARQFRITQTSRAGMLAGLPDFALGRGLDIRPAVTSGGGVPAPSAPVDGLFRPSLDITQRLGANVTASMTVNTDFAETEVDTRRTNLTRFPLLFPEKRTFFLEGLKIDDGDTPHAIVQPSTVPARANPLTPYSSKYEV